MNWSSPLLRQSPLVYVGFTMVVALAAGFFVLNPLWSVYSLPFAMPRVLPPITAPLDGPFYLQNAEEGYRWGTRDSLSLLFHPMLSFLIWLAPKWYPGNIWFWLISMVFGFGSLRLLYEIMRIYATKLHPPSYILPLVLLAPGGLELSTGNPEIPALFFASALLLSVLKWHKSLLTVVFAFAAILTKPNALYMIPMLSIYAAPIGNDRDTNEVKQAIIAIAALLFGWLGWMLIVDWQTGTLGSYWEARLQSIEYVAGSPARFFEELARSFVDSDEIRDRIRYSSSLIIPFVGLWAIGLLSFSRERHRYAIAAGIVGMLGIALWGGNPNKIIVYATTIPGYFAVYVLLFKQLLVRGQTDCWLVHVLVLSILLGYCAAIVIVYVFGMPLGWYY